MALYRFQIETEAGNILEGACEHILAIREGKAHLGNRRQPRGWNPRCMFVENATACTCEEIKSEPEKP